jgi:hypothetical protein
MPLENSISEVYVMMLFYAEVLEEMEEPTPPSHNLP